jgi:CRISPR/Cas system-associated exonuclease Cas4 (RecB family)
MEAAVLGRLGILPADREVAARPFFDSAMRQLFDSSHALIRVKFSSPERVPFYNLYRERAAQKAADLPLALAAETVSSNSGDDGEGSATGVLAEKELYSRDRLIKGRADCVDRSQRLVIDYKSGGALGIEQGEITDGEKRQLILYAYLLRENQIPIEKGRIERADGRIAEMVISAEVAENEAFAARAVLADFNSEAQNGQFARLATPSPSSCAGCQCIPVCEAFWETADKTWIDLVGVHAQATVEEVAAASVGDVDVASFVVAVTGGTIPHGRASVEQVPVKWLLADGSTLLEPGESVRIVNAKLVSDEPVVIRTNRITTAVWGPIETSC